MEPVFRNRKNIDWFITPLSLPNSLNCYFVIMFEALLKGLTLGLLLSISVGPVIFSIIKQSLNNGHRGGMAFVFGVSASDISLAFVSNFFTELFGSLSSLRTEIGIAGSTFLII